MRCCPAFPCVSASLREDNGGRSHTAGCRRCRDNCARDAEILAKRLDTLRAEQYILFVIHFSSYFLGGLPYVQQQTPEGLVPKMIRP